MATDPLEARLDRVETALVRLAEAQARTQEQLAQLTAGVDALAEAQRRTEEQLQQLTARVDALTARVEEVASSVARAEDQIALLARETGRLKGWSLEVRYRDKAHAYFQRILRRISSVPAEELETLADEAEDKGVLSSDEHADLMYADVVLRGELRDGRTEAYLLAEVSSVVDPQDVERAVRRAKLLARLVSPPVIAAVAGEWIAAGAEREARRLGVWRVLDGRVFSPDVPAVEL